MPDTGSSGSWHQHLLRPNAEFPRVFIKSDTDLSKWDHLTVYADDLLSRTLKTAGDLDIWICNYTEFQNAILEEGSRLYIDMTCDTASREKENAYIKFVEDFEPRYKQLEFNLKKKINTEILFKQPGREEYLRWLSSVKTGIDLFTEENLSLDARVSKLSQQYQKICGSMNVQWEGETKTVAQMAPFLQKSDRVVREKAWKKSMDCYLNAAGQLNEIFEELYRIRLRIAKNIGLIDFREYCFKKYERTDYTYRNCYQFHESIKECVLPHYREIICHRKRQLELDSIRPWDLDCDVFGSAPLKPFTTTGELIEKTGNIFQRIDPELYEHYLTMRSKNLLDLENRMGKAPGGYQCALDESRLPFIFMNSVGVNQDIFTLLHECGHAFHQFEVKKFSLAYNREAPMEFSEVASMSMERFGMSHLELFYTPREKARAVIMEDQDVFRLLVWVAVVDKFQHWLYTHPGHSSEERKKTWLEINQEFSYGVDWNGLEDFQEISWMKQLHIFEHPFYYLEYGIAQFGALQFWRQYLKDSPGTIARYKTALGYGNTKSLKELFHTAGLKFGFTQELFEPVIESVYQEWRELISEIEHNRNIANLCK